MGPAFVREIPQSETVVCHKLLFASYRIDCSLPLLVRMTTEAVIPDHRSYAFGRALDWDDEILLVQTMENQTDHGAGTEILWYQHLLRSHPHGFDRFDRT